MSPSQQLAERVSAQRWYHTIELAPGLTTPGWFDMRPYVRHYGLPERMDGMRVLDVGTWDGFWAFEMERRGAEVFALDVNTEAEYDWPPRRRPAVFSDEYRGHGFELAHEILQSSVTRVHCNIYDASPERLGTFDLVFCGTVLIHLRDQLLALERLASVCDGQFVFADEYDRLSSLVPFPVSRYHADRDLAVVFWLPARRTWRRMLWTAGFDRVTEHGTFRLKLGGKRVIPHVVLHGWHGAGRGAGAPAGGSAGGGGAPGGGPAQPPR